MRTELVFIFRAVVGWLSILFCQAVLNADGADAEFFETRIRPLLAGHCVKCHGKKKQESGLRLDTKAGFLRGGDSGVLLDTKNPGRSLILEAIRHSDALKMPPDKKLSDQQIADFEKWLLQGAAWPASTVDSVGPTDPTKHWAFQPVRRIEPPQLDSTWPVNPIDQFILRKLNRVGLSPAPVASEIVRLRRACFDLTGLPPSIDQIEKFQAEMANNSTAGFARFVDRLLESPRYGERWGRFWLDVARYADNKGYVFFEDKNYPWAWTYRDYVIRSFNEDLPYDRFIIEQLAADQLDLGDDQRALAAMGFLTVGARFMNNSHDVIDDRIDVVTRGLMGLTVTCARCHDHKFDPIPQADYYSLYGVFRSSHEPFVPPLFEKTPDTEEYKKYAVGMQERLAKLEKFIDQQRTLLMQGARQRVAEYLLAVHRRRKHPNTENFMLLTEKGQIIPKIITRWETYLKKARRTDDPVWHAWFVFSDLEDADWLESDGRLDKSYVRLIESPAGNGIVRQAFKQKKPKSMADVAETYAQVLLKVDAEWQRVVKDAQKRNQPIPTRLPNDTKEALRQTFYGTGSPPMISNVMNWGFLDLLPDRPTQGEYKKLLKEVENFSRAAPGAPPRAMVLNDNTEIYEPVVFVRGNPNRPGRRVPRRMPAIVRQTAQWNSSDHGGSSEKEQQTALGRIGAFTKGSGRLELAQQIASKSNPLTARVLVNRVWKHHFGQGLVATPSDFGLRSEAPSHPELLDWLAMWFMDNGWSVKRLHRLIMTSSTYQQAAGHQPVADFGRRAKQVPAKATHPEANTAAMRIDPANRLLWKFNRRRLDFEAMRDSLLAVTGQMSSSMGGPAANLSGFNPRRTIYGFVNRMDLPSLRRAFDFPEPAATSPGREITTIAPQALFFMNHEFTIQCAKRVAVHPEVTSRKAFNERVNQVYRLLFSRAADPEELAIADNFVNRANKAKQSSPWQYGYGGVDPKTDRVTSFTQLTWWTGSRLQASGQLPDPSVGWLFFDAHGGHPASSDDRCAIRRWVAPQSGRISIESDLEHVPEEGNGIRARIVSSAQGTLGEWIVDHSKAKPAVQDLAVEKGDTIDFVSDWRGHITHDEHIWKITIVLKPSTIANNRSPRQSAAAKLTWNSVDDFRSDQSDRWVDYIHSLLMTNEFLFVD